MAKTGLSKKIDTRIDSDLYAKVEAAAKREERSVGAIVRRALRAYVK